MHTNSIHADCRVRSIQLTQKCALNTFCCAAQNFIYSKILSFGFFCSEEKTKSWLERKHNFFLFHRAVAHLSLWSILMFCGRWHFSVHSPFACECVCMLFLLSLNSSHLPFIKSIWDLSDIPWYRTYIRTIDRIKHINLIKTIPCFVTTNAYIDLFIFILLWIAKGVYFSLNICSIVNQWH